MVGVHKRVGEIRRQDQAISIDVLLEVNRAVEARWAQTANPEIRRWVAEMGTWFNCGFCTGLRGDEIVCIEFAGTAKSVTKWMQRNVDSFFMLVVTGRSKGNQLSGAKFSVPSMKHTEGTNLSSGIWIERLVKEMKAAIGYKIGAVIPAKIGSSSHERMGK
jgi:hypothetical protein